MPDVFDSSHDGAASRNSESAAGDAQKKPTNQEQSAISSPAKPRPRTKKVEEYSEVMRHEKPAQNPLLAFAPMPVQVFFDTQESNERVLLLLRRAPITQLGWIATAIGLILFPFLFTIVPLFDPFPARFTLAALILWYLIVFGYVIESFLSWFFSVYIITDERIIDVDFLSLIYKDITAAKIDNIEEITAVTGGALQSAFNFGTVKIQTAGATNELFFEDVPQPAKVTRLLNELLLEEELEKVEGRIV